MELRINSNLVLQPYCLMLSLIKSEEGLTIQLKSGKYIDKWLAHAKELVQCEVGHPALAA